MKNALLLVFNTAFAVLNFICYAEGKEWYTLVAGILCTTAVILIMCTTKGEK
jgi:hypothetical protein